MKTNNIIQKTSLAFANKIVNALKHLQAEKSKFALTKQSHRSEMLICINNLKDLLAIFFIFSKEVKESKYRLRFLEATNCTRYPQANQFHTRNSPFLIPPYRVASLIPIAK